MHDAAGITSIRHNVEAGHHVVREIATSGTPVPPAPAPRRLAQEPLPGAYRGGRDAAWRDSTRRDSTGRDSSRRDSSGRDGTGRGTAGRPARGSGPYARHPGRPRGAAPGRPARAPSSS
jgi:hypothetical protein